MVTRTWWHPRRGKSIIPDRRLRQHFFLPRPRRPGVRAATRRGYIFFHGDVRKREETRQTGVYITHAHQDRIGVTTPGIRYRPSRHETRRSFGIFSRQSWKLFILRRIFRRFTCPLRSSVSSDNKYLKRHFVSIVFSVLVAALNFQRSTASDGDWKYNLHPIENLFVGLALFIFLTLRITNRREIGMLVETRRNVLTVFAQTLLGNRRTGQFRVRSLAGRPTIIRQSACRYSRACISCNKHNSHEPQDPLARCESFVGYWFSSVIPAWNALLITQCFCDSVSTSVALLVVIKGIWPPVNCAR